MYIYIYICYNVMFTLYCSRVYHITCLSDSTTYTFLMRVPLQLTLTFEGRISLEANGSRANF